MSNSQFTIYNASAGSGKTYTLAKAYIKLLLQSNNPLQFRHILAITFTNKAVGEMKGRIVTMLKLFSSMVSEEEHEPMLTDICKELSLSIDTIKAKSQIILKSLLHNYGAFEITTIDAFTHKLIRTFAHDLRLPLNFEVELDQERLLNEAVDKLIGKAGVNESLTKTLLKFAIDKTEDDKSWDISYDLNDISGILLKENDLPHIKKLQEKTLADFSKLKEILNEQLHQKQIYLQSIAIEALDLIDASGLHHNDFSGKYLPNYLIKLSHGSLSVAFGAKWQQNLIEGEPLYPKRVSEAVASEIDSIQPKLGEVFSATKALFFEIKLLKTILSNLTPLSVINLIAQELRDLKVDKNVMLISEFNSIISNEIKNQPTPFIYERIGERFNHFFIDEFQDTSKLQWQNLVPLLDNSMSGDRGTSMIVGDAKQSIYRWRGSDPEQFIALYNNKNPFQTESEILNLKTNYRSSESIIAFNNSFFTHIGNTFFDHNDHVLLYSKAGQQKYLTSSGLVNLKFLDVQKSEDREEMYSQEVLETIYSCLQRGFAHKDICIITRKRIEGVAIAKYLSENNIPITSSETLLLKNSPNVRFLISILKLLIQPLNFQLRIEILQFIASRREIENRHDYYLEHLNREIDDFLTGINPKNGPTSLTDLLQCPLYELVEKLIIIYDLNEGSDAYLQFFLDEVLEFVQSKTSDITNFVRYFESHEDKLSIVVSDDVNAVQIMTIHKSKGLEFPVVIFPFADLDIYKELKPKIWFPVNKDLYNGFENMLINFNKDVEYYGEIGTTLYNNRRQQLALDNINLLYVVMTRPVNELHIISKVDIKATGEANTNSFSGLFINYLKHENLWSDNQSSYMFGEQIQYTTQSHQVISEELSLISNQKEENNIKIVTKASLLWNPNLSMAIERGNLVHHVLSKIKSRTDLNFAFDELKISGVLNEKNITPIRLLVEELINHAELKVYFDNPYKVYNEKDILEFSGSVIRPDRININSKNEATIIDYKTGSKKETHKNQLNTYEKLVSKMGFLVVKKLIVYVNDTIEIIEV